MEIIDRLFVMLLTLLVGITSVFMIGLSFGVISFEAVEAFFAILEGSIELGVVGAVLFLISIRVLQLFFRRKKVSGAIVVMNEFGNVRITLDAINSLVKEVIEEEGQFDNIDSKVKVKDDCVNIRMNLTSDTRANIPELATSLQEMVKERVASTTGVEISKVEILIKEIQKKKRLRVD
ncbi:alkaline shock response membrane anchor protein AmaP [Halonatronum saccharophilum]|uniref:alkaline shock response membrane anchor protein AmaP n=1 Tax=Halonatronum saccharophilum TaxID=150060 RepID=UPI0004880F26|nr:alkaline shock response membrane anchor protein AmaP [Halonatronum saccharophilum]